MRTSRAIAQSYAWMVKNPNASDRSPEAMDKSTTLGRRRAAPAVVGRGTRVRGRRAVRRPRPLPPQRALLQPRRPAVRLRPRVRDRRRVRPRRDRRAPDRARPDPPPRARQAPLEPRPAGARRDARRRDPQRDRRQRGRDAAGDVDRSVSSLSYLHSLPLDTLKVAKPFIDGLTSGRRESSFVGMIVDLANGAAARELALNRLEVPVRLARERPGHEQAGDTGDGGAEVQ